jgi:hypothetical protein
MKTTTVPAQITTVEDKIAGNLSMSQLMLMAMPVFLSGGLYIIFPPFMSLTVLKLVLGSVLLAVFFVLAIRIRGKILLTWLIVIGSYNIRPRYYLYDKNDTHLRSVEQNKAQISEETNEKIVPKPMEAVPTPQLAMPARVQLERAIADPRAKLQFLTRRKGGLDVHITEIKQEG